MMMLAVPMVGAGLSFEGDAAAALELARLMALGAGYGWLLCLCWPDQRAQVRAGLPGRAEMIEYGARASAWRERPAPGSDTCSTWTTRAGPPRPACWSCALAPR